MSFVIEAIKRIYPGINGGFVYWQTKPDGTEWNRPEDGLIWNNLQFPRPTWDQIEEKREVVEIENLKNQLINSRRSYLSSTDWYVLKEFDIPNSYPEEIRNRRIEIWQEIDEINNAQSLESLGEFDLTVE